MSPALAAALPGFDVVREDQGRSYPVGTALPELLKVLRDLNIELISVDMVQTG